MRIAMLIGRFPPVIGGAEIQCYRLSKELVRHGHSVTVLTERNDPHYVVREKMDGVEVIRFRTLGSPPFSSLIYGLQAAIYLLRRSDFDVLHAHMIATPAFVALMIRFFFRKPVLIKVTGGRKTGDFGTSKVLWRGQFKLWLLKCARPFLVCPSQETYDEARAIGIPTNHLAHIPNGVDTDHFKDVSLESKKSIRASLQWPEEALTAVYAGRCAPGKGVETLLSVWERGVKSPDFLWDLVLLLAEQPSAALENRISALGKRVRVIIGATDLAVYYQAGDLAVLFSEGEGLSNFLLESMACSLGALTSAAATPGYSDEQNGVTTLPLPINIDNAAQTLVQFSRQTDRLRTLGRNARRLIENRFSLNQITRQYEELYSKIND